MGLTQCCRLTVSVPGLSTEGNPRRFWQHVAPEAQGGLCRHQTLGLTSQPASLCVILPTSQHVVQLPRKPSSLTSLNTSTPAQPRAHGFDQPPPPLLTPADSCAVPVEASVAPRQAEAVRSSFGGLLRLQDVLRRPALQATRGPRADAAPARRVATCGWVERTVRGTALRRPPRRVGRSPTT